MYRFVLLAIFCLFIPDKGDAMLPTVLITSGSNPVIEDQSLTLNCSYTHGNTTSVKWLFSNTLIQNQEVGTGELFTKTFSRTDAGEYACAIYKNGTFNKISADFQISVYYIDQPTLRFEPAEIEEGQTFGFLCEVQNSNPVKWVKSFVRDNVDLNNLNLITVAQTNMQGLYQCRASNGQVTKISEAVMLNVKRTLNITFTSSASSYIIGIPFTLTCAASTAKGTIDQYKWTKNGVTMNNNASVLNVIPTIRDDGVAYQCSARASDSDDGYEYTKTSNKIIISVGMEARITPEKTKVKVGETYALKCSVLQDQPGVRVTYIWYRNNKVLPGYSDQPVVAFEAMEEEKDSTIEYECMAMYDNGVNAKSGKALIEVEEEYVEWKSSLVIGLTVGTVIGGICLVILIVLLIIWCCCAHQSNPKYVVSEKKEKEKEKVARTSSKFSNVSSKTVRLNYTSQLSDRSSVKFAPDYNDTKIIIEEESEPEEDDCYEELAIKEDVCIMPSKNNAHNEFHLVSDEGNIIEKEKASKADSNFSGMSFTPIPGAMPEFQPPDMSDSDIYQTETDNEIYNDKAPSVRSVSFNDTSHLIPESESNVSDNDIQFDDAELEGDYISDNEELKNIRENLKKPIEIDQENLLAASNIYNDHGNAPSYDSYDSYSDYDDDASDYYGEINGLNSAPPKNSLPALPMTELNSHNNDSVDFKPAPKMSLPTLPSIVVNSDEELDLDKTGNNTNSLPNGGVVNMSYDSDV